MPGPTPKPASLRQRTNKRTTRALLPSVKSMAKAKVPPLPGGPQEGWHPMVTAWWTDVWRSPMASEYLDADVHGLYRLAVLHQDFWSSTSITGRLAAAAEIRLAGVPYGLSPIDRSRLQWEIEKGEQAEEKTGRRRETKKPEKNDPREMLKVVS